MNNERLTTVNLGRHTAEYDHKIQEVRLSWSGDQTFLLEWECRRLLTLLQEVLG